MNSAALIQRCTKAQVAVDWVLNIGAFDLKKKLEMDPGARAAHIRAHSHLQPPRIASAYCTRIASACRPPRT